MIEYGCALLTIGIAGAFGVLAILHVPARSREKDLKAFNEAFSRLQRSLDLFLKWQDARPFLWIGQSAYARALLFDMIDAVICMRHYYSRYYAFGVGKCDRVLQELKSILQQDPPPYNPDNPELQPELVFISTNHALRFPVAIIHRSFI
jgi:hypothetical protein